MFPCWIGFALPCAKPVSWWGCNLEAVDFAAADAWTEKKVIGELRGRWLSMVPAIFHQLKTVFKKTSHDS